MLGWGVFGDFVFADLNAIGRPAGPAGGGGRGRIGAQGFPADFNAIIAANAAQDRRERERLKRELEVVALIETGLL